MRPLLRLCTGIGSALLLCAPSLGSCPDGTLRAFGDSITAGTGDDGRGGGWPPRLETLLREAGCDVEVTSHGVGGEATPEGLSRINGVLDLGGDVLLLMEGTNDITRRTISPETTTFNLHEMSRRAQVRGFEVVHATVIPRWPRSRVDENNITNGHLNRLIRGLAGNTAKDLVDNFEIFGQTPDRFRALYSDDFPRDPVGHPNGVGYDVLARTYFDALTGIDSVPPVPGLLDPADREDDVPFRPTIRVDVWDFGRKIDNDASFLVIDGEVVDAAKVDAGRRTSFFYRPPRNLSGAVTVGLRARDRAKPPNELDRDFATFFIVGTTFSDADLNLDGRVDGWDAVIVGLAHGAVAGEFRFDRRADLNGDDVVDDADLDILESFFGS